MLDADFFIDTSNNLMFFLRSSHVSLITDFPTGSYSTENGNIFFLVPSSFLCVTWKPSTSRRFVSVYLKSLIQRARNVNETYWIRGLSWSIETRRILDDK